MFPRESEYYDREELKEIIETRIKYHNDFENPNLKVTAFTEDMATLSKEFLSRYGFKDKISELKGFNINSFTQIGLEDPWPDDENRLTGSLDDIDPKVYKRPEKAMDLVYQK